MHKSDSLKRVALSEGFDTVGVCPSVEPPHIQAYFDWLNGGNHAGMSYMESSREQRSSPQALLPGAKSILAVSLNYNNGEGAANGNGKVARYAHGRDYHKVLKKKLHRIAEWAESEFPQIKTRACVDSAPILEREYASLAGLGWFGKNTCLIDSVRGSWFFIGLLLLDQEFEPDKPSVGSCGRCTACIDACPTGALVWNGGQVAVMDSSRCISYLTIEHSEEFTNEQANMLNGWVFGCDICQEVCPFNQPRESQPSRAEKTRETDFASRLESQLLDPNWLAEADDENLMTKFAGSALMRAVPNRLRRNARALLQ